MNRLEILVLDRRNGVICNEYIDTQSVMSFFHRTGNIHRFQIVARRGKHALFIEKIDPVTVAKELSDFDIQQFPTT